MSMSQVVKDAINHQINAELSASYQYLAMSAFCEKQNLRGFGRWLRLQSQEEYGHGMKLFDFMIARGCDVELQPLTAPTVTFGSLVEVFETVQRQEQEVSAQIDALIRAGVPGEGVCRDCRTAVVRDRAGRGGTVREGNPLQDSSGAERPRLGARPRSRPGLARTGIVQARSGGVEQRQLLPAWCTYNSVAASA